MPGPAVSTRFEFDRKKNRNHAFIFYRPSFCRLNSLPFMPINRTIETVRPTQAESSSLQAIHWANITHRHVTFEQFPDSCTGKKMGGKK